MPQALVKRRTSRHQPFCARASRFASGRICLRGPSRPRGCPLNCNFCSVTTFNGAPYRQRGPSHQICSCANSSRSLRNACWWWTTISWTRPEHVAGPKKCSAPSPPQTCTSNGLPRPPSILPTTTNYGRWPQKLDATASSSVLNRDFGRASGTRQEVRFDQGPELSRLGDGASNGTKILVVRSFIISLDVDERGIGKRSRPRPPPVRRGLSTTLFLTPLPGTRLWEQMNSERAHSPQ